MHRSSILGPILALALSPLQPAAAAADAPPVATALARTHTDAGLAWGPCPAFLPQGCAIAVLRGDPAKANADIYFRVPAGAEIVRHWHTSAERMVLVSGELTVTYDGHDATVLRPGTYAYGPARLPHSARCAEGEACVLFIAFEAPVDAFEGDAPPAE